MTAQRSPARMVIEAVRKWLVVKDEQLPVLPLAVAVANQLPGPAVWLTMVAPSSWGKSDLILPVSTLPGVHFMSKVTDKTFASGKKPEATDTRHLSLLDQLRAEGNWMLAIKDLGTIQSLPAPTRAAIFGQLREIYEGAFRANYGTGVEVTWEGKLGLLAASTNIIDDYTKWSADLGERFVYFRLWASPQAMVAARAWSAVHTDTDDRRLETLAAAYGEAFDLATEVASQSNGWRAPPLECGLICGMVAEFVVATRTPIRHDRSGGYELGENEGTGRLTKVLAQLHRAATLCYGGDFDLATRLVIRIGLDSLPRRRMVGLRALARHQDGVTAKTLATWLRCDATSAARHANDLVTLDLARREKPANRVVYVPSTGLVNFAEAVCLDEECPDEALRKVFNGDGGVVTKFGQGP